MLKFELDPELELELDETRISDTLDEIDEDSVKDDDDDDDDDDNDDDEDEDEDANNSDDDGENNGDIDDGLDNDSFCSIADAAFTIVNGIIDIIVGDDGEDMDNDPAGNPDFNPAFDPVFCCCCDERDDGISVIGEENEGIRDEDNNKCDKLVERGVCNDSMGESCGCGCGCGCGCADCIGWIGSVGCICIISS